MTISCHKLLFLMFFACMKLLYDIFVSNVMARQCDKFTCHFYERKQLLLGRICDFSPISRCISVTVRDKA